MRVEVVESIAEGKAAEGKPVDETLVKLALQSFQSAIQGDASFFDSRRAGNLELAGGHEGHTICSGGFLFSFRGKELGGNRGLYFQLIQKLFELLKNAGSAELLSARLCLVSEKLEEGMPGGLALRVDLEAVGDSNEQATLRWGLGLAHLQQALLFTSRYLRQKTSQKSG
jgi:hypothetical protein